jgi:monovalent cation:H+ antiporter-2, CPA2 family
VGTTLLIGGVAERFHVSAAVGAFLVGIGLSGPAADRARSLLGPIRDLFGAVFFVFFGLRTDPGTIPPVLGAALLLAAAALLTKLAGGWWIAGRAGAGRRGRFRAGSLLVARGEFSMAIAAVGVSAGARTTLAPITATLVLSLAVVGPLLVRLAGARAGSHREPGAARAEPSWDNDRRSEGA